MLAKSSKFIDISFLFLEWRTKPVEILAASHPSIRGRPQSSPCTSIIQIV